MTQSKKRCSRARRKYGQTSLIDAQIAICSDTKRGAIFAQAIKRLARENLAQTGCAS